MFSGTPDLCNMGQLVTGMEPHNFTSPPETLLGKVPTEGVARVEDIPEC